MSKEPVKGSGLVTSVVEAAEAAAPSTLDAEKNMPVAINGIGDADDVSRSVRRGKGTQKPHEVNGISEDRLTGPVAMRFNSSSVQRPLAAASRVASSGNRIVLEGEGGYIDSVATGDRIALRLERGVYVFDVILPSGEYRTRFRRWSVCLARDMAGCGGVGSERRKSFYDSGEWDADL